MKRNIETLIAEQEYSCQDLHKTVKGLSTQFNSPVFSDLNKLSNYI